MEGEILPKTGEKEGSRKDSSTLSSPFASEGDSKPEVHVGGSKECCVDGCTNQVPIGSNSGICIGCYSYMLDQRPGRISFGIL